MIKHFRYFLCHNCFSKLTIETLEQDVKYVQNQQHFTPYSTVFIVNFEHAIAGWVKAYLDMVYTSQNELLFH